MCGIFGAACGNASRACHCMSLRSFAFLWLAISIIVAGVQFVAGAFFSSYLSPVDRMLHDIRKSIMSMSNPTIALSYYSIIADSLSTLWRGMSLITTVRGVYDIIALACWGFGWYKRRMTWVYIFIGMTAVDFAVDLLLLIIFLTLLNVFYVAYFYPIAMLLPFVFYGWQAILGPYILHLLLSHAYVLSEGGNGTEMKSWKELKDAKTKTASKDVEEAPLLDSADEKKKNSPPADASKDVSSDAVGDEPTIEVVSEDAS